MTGRAVRRRWHERLELLEEELKPLMAEIAEARSALVALGPEASLDERRTAHRRLRLAYLAADRDLRAATRETKKVSRQEWCRLRTRLSALDTARQQHLMQERDEVGLLPLGSVRALDTGMSGPALGFHLHGRTKEPGAPAAYGLDAEAALEAEPVARVVPADEAALAHEATPAPEALVPATPLADHRWVEAELEPTLETAARRVLAPAR